MLEWMKPSLLEIITYIPIFVISIILIQLFQSMIIKKKVQKTSRCYQLKYSIKTPTTVNVKNTDGVSLYNIKYDIAHKTMSLDCACPTGATVNTFNNIKLYNFATHASEYGHLTCSCDSQYGNSEKMIATEEYLLNTLRNQHIQSIKDDIYSKTTLTDAENTDFINFLNSITVSYKPGFFNVGKYMDDVIAEQGIRLTLNDSSKNNIKGIVTNIIRNVLVGDIDISLKSTIKNNLIKNNSNLSQEELAIIFIIVDTLNNPIINKGNNVIEYTIHIKFPSNSNNGVNKSLMMNPGVLAEYKNKSIKDLIKIYYGTRGTINDVNGDSIDIIINYDGTILQSEESKDFVYEGNPDIIRYMESDDMNIFERNILSDV